MEKVKKGLRWSCSNSEEDCRVVHKCNGSNSGGSEGEERYISCEPLNANDHSSRKRVKLQDKASEDYNPVDLAVVPRKLRSAINKRLSQSMSPPLSDSKRRQLHTLNGTQLSNGYTAERFRQNMLDQVTKDEEEVAEALTTLASLITICTSMPNEDDRRNLEENSETKANLTALSVSKEETTKSHFPCNDSITANSFPCVEGSHEVILEAETSGLEQPIAAYVSENFDAGGNGTTPSNPLGTPLRYLARNGGLQQTQLDASSIHKCDIALWPLGSASMEQDLQSVKQKLDSGTTHYLSHKDTTSGWLGLPRTAPMQLTISSSSKTTGTQRSIAASTRCSSTRNDLPTEVFPLPTTDGKTPRKKCATHVYISLLVRKYQDAEKKQRSLPGSQSKVKEGISSALQTSKITMGLRNGTDPPMANGFHLERSSLEGSTHVVQDRSLVQACMVSTLSGTYAQQKQGGDHFSIVAAGDAKNLGNGSKPSGQLPVPFLSHHSLMPFPFSQGPYSSHYQDQLTAAANHQVKLQLPHYMGTGPLYGPPQMVQVAGGTATKQQQMWQAQMAHYRPPPGFPAKWHQSRQHPDSFQSSSSLHTQAPSTIFPLPKDFHPLNVQQHFVPPVPSSYSSLPSRPTQQHQHSGGGLKLEGSSQRQMLCNGETFR